MVRRTPGERVISTILELCDGQYLTLEELSFLLNRNKDTLRTHYINPMLQNGQLEQKYKNITTHPNQKYRAVMGVGISDGDN